MGSTTCSIFCCASRTVNFRQITASLYTSRILTGIRGHTLLRILQRLSLIKFTRVFLQQFAGGQIHQSRVMRAAKVSATASASIPGASALTLPDIALLIQRPLRLLAGFQPHGRARHHDGADQTKHQHHQQRFADAIVTFLLSHATSSA